MGVTRVRLALQPDGPANDSVTSFAAEAPPCDRSDSLAGAGPAKADVVGSQQNEAAGSHQLVEWAGRRFDSAPAANLESREGQ